MKKKFIFAEPNETFTIKNLGGIDYKTSDSVLGPLELGNWKIENYPNIPNLGEIDSCCPKLEIGKTIIDGGLYTEDELKKLFFETRKFIGNIKIETYEDGLYWRVSDFNRSISLIKKRDDGSIDIVEIRRKIKNNKWGVFSDYFHQGLNEQGWISPDYFNSMDLRKEMII